LEAVAQGIVLEIRNEVIVFCLLAKFRGWFGGLGLDATGQFFEMIGFVPGRRHALMAGMAETAAASYWRSSCNDSLTVPRKSRLVSWGEDSGAPDNGSKINGLDLASPAFSTPSPATNMSAVTKTVGIVVSEGSVVRLFCHDHWWAKSFPRFG
jgi:hypothetical protein